MRNWLSVLPFLVVIVLVLGLVFSGGGPILTSTQKGPTVGQPAPEIEGVDLDGTRFKLSDYQGKVVLLSFSGEWCSACRYFHRYERALVKELQGKPFIALGVNTDRSPEILKEAQAESQVPIRAWFDGQTDGAPGGPITREWEVDGFPTIIVIDHKGVIRFRESGFGDIRPLQREINRRISDAEAAGG